MYTVPEIRALIAAGQKKKIYDDPDWKRLRLIALKRDNYECQECKKEGKLSIKQNQKLDEHHIKEIEKYPELTYVLSNIETVCVMHHNILDGKVLCGNKRPKKDKFINEERW